MPKVIIQFNTDGYDVPEDFFRAYSTDPNENLKNREFRVAMVQRNPNAPIRVRFIEKMTVEQLHQVANMIRAEADDVAGCIDEWADFGGDQPGGTDRALYPPPRSVEAQEAALRGMETCMKRA